MINYCWQSYFGLTNTEIYIVQKITLHERGLNDCGTFYSYLRLDRQLLDTLILQNYFCYRLHFSVKYFCSEGKTSHLIKKQHLTHFWSQQYIRDICCTYSYLFHHEHIFICKNFQNTHQNQITVLLLELILLARFARLIQESNPYSPRYQGTNNPREPQP